MEISVNAFFAVLFGCSLLFMGCLILYRVNALQWSSLGGEGSSQPKRSMSTYVVMLFACLVVTAGLFCFFLEKDWIKFISPSAKIPMYTLLGVALWFALTFSIMDLCNFFGQWVVSKFTKGRRIWQPIVSTPTQICVVLASAVIMGMFFGIVFGSLDVEDHLVTGISQDYHYTLPVGTLTCAVVGAINQAFLRPSLYGDPLGLDAEYAPRGKANYDDGI